MSTTLFLQINNYLVPTKVVKQDDEENQHPLNVRFLVDENGLRQYWFRINQDLSTEKQETILEALVNDYNCSVENNCLVRNGALSDMFELIPYCEVLCRLRTWQNLRIDKIWSLLDGKTLSTQDKYYPTFKLPPPPTPKELVFQPCSCKEHSGNMYQRISCTERRYYEKKKNDMITKSILTSPKQSLFNRLTYEDALKIASFVPAHTVKDYI